MKYEGQIADFPQEVVERMLHEQVSQGNKRDVKVFETDVNANKAEGGFDWMNTEVPLPFWPGVICDKNFTLFFERYPKTKPMTLTPKEKALVRMALGSMERRTLRQADKAKNSARAEILTLVAQDFAALSERFK
jgi:hypothetical protein